MCAFVLDGSYFTFNKRMILIVCHTGFSVGGQIAHATGTHRPGQFNYKAQFADDRWRCHSGKSAAHELDI